ncbi:hypothetical protein BC940DRAFT_308621 [Gongronella butleri]|nr:hypothetical protein BC940DRAFT_308621 [Gongronella butleri]
MADFPSYPFTTLHELIDFRLKEAANAHPLYIDAETGDTVNVFKFRRLSKGVNAGLRQLGIGKGDGVGVFSPNTINTVAAHVGIWMSGAYIAALNCNYKGAEFEHQLKMSKCKVLFAHPDTLDVALPYCKKYGIKHVYSMVTDPKGRVPCWIDAFVAPNAQNAQNHDNVPVATLSQKETRTTLAILFFSSGTTGLSKGVMCSHYQYVSNIFEAMNAAQDPNDPQAAQAPEKTTVSLGVMPFYHAAGFMQSMTVPCITLGTTVVFRRYSVPAMCQAIQDFKVTSFNSVPPMLLHIMNRPEVQKYDLSSVDTFSVGAAPISGEVIQTITSRFNRPVVQGFGMTELGPMITRTPPNSSKPGSIGKPIGHVHLRVVDENGKDLGPNQPGELWARGPQRMIGYMDNEKATREMVDDDGYVHTGDVGYYDEEGYFYIVDRIKELIKTKGMQVAPVELEAVLLSCPLVADAGVIGVYDDVEATEFPMAFIVLHEGHNADDDVARKIHAWLNDRVAHFKRLRGGILFVDAIPKSAAGKLQRRDMKTMYKRLTATQMAKL